MHNLEWYTKPSCRAGDWFEEDVALLTQNVLLHMWSRRAYPYLMHGTPRQHHHMFVCFPFKSSWKLLLTSTTWMGRCLGTSAWFKGLHVVEWSTKTHSLSICKTTVRDCSQKHIYTFDRMGGVCCFCVYYTSPSNWITPSASPTSPTATPSSSPSGISMRSNPDNTSIVVSNKTPNRRARKCHHA